MDTSVERSCGNKIKFTAEVDAVIHLRKMIIEGSAKKWEMKPYKCEHCEFYHIGHADRKTQRFVKNFVKKQRPPAPLIKLKKK